jgi:uncharacterized protein with PIN domain
MEERSFFRFHGSLNDFLPFARRNTWTSYGFRGKPAVKDAIEAIGVPHPEVDLILVNHSPVGFFHPLQPQDQVEVYPANPTDQRPGGMDPLAKPASGSKFVLDVHLGKLAKAMRMLGFDTCYQNDLSDKAIAAIAEEENRIVLTRDVGLLKHKAIRRGYWLRSQQPEEQVEEVIRRFRLEKELHPFTRCLACNSQIVAVAKETVWNRLPPQTKRYFHEFFQCPTCERVYWKGSHFDRMQEYIRKVTAPKEREEK